MQKTDKYYSVIIHSNYQSLYNLKRNQWVKHACFPHKIISFFIQTDAQGMEQGIMLENGDVYFTNTKDTRDSYTRQDAAFNIGGRLCCSSEEYSAGNIYLCIVEARGKFKVVFIQKKLLLAEYQSDLITKDSAVCLLQNSAPQYHFLIQTAKVNLDLYKICANEEESEIQLVKRMPTFNQITGLLHSGINFNNHQAYALFDDHNVLIVNNKEKNVDVFSGKKYQKVVYEGNNFVYGLVKRNESQKREEGLRYMDLEDVVENHRLNDILLYEFDLNPLPEIVVNDELERITFIESYHSIKSIPRPHRNCIRFMGIGPSSQIMCYKQLGDKYIVLTTSGILETYDIVTAQVIYSKKLKEGWFSKFVIPNIATTPLNVRQRVMVMSKESLPPDQYNLSAFYEPWQLNQLFSGQVQHVLHRTNDVREYKYIEIKNPDEIIEHFSFTHPKTPVQWLYVNNKLDRIIEKIDYYNTYIYKVVRVSGKQIRLEQLKKMDDYPREFIPVNPDFRTRHKLKTTESFLLFFSPDFSHFLDIERKRGLFVIRDTYTGQLVCEVPKDMIYFENKKEAQNAIQRFRWLDNCRFKIVNKNGMEKIVNYEKGCTQVAFNTIPEFEKYPDEWKNAPYYYCLPRITISEQLPHYQRKIRRYKSMYYLDQQRDAQSMNAMLYSVESLQLLHSNLSFSFLDWKIIELICEGAVDILNLTDPMIQCILNCILPGGNTLLHKICEHQQSDDLQTLFRKSQPDKSNLEDIRFQIPIYPNFKGETPLHIALKNQDYRSIDAMLGYLKGYPIDHHSRAIKDLIPVFIQKDLPELIPYLTSRVKQTPQLALVTKGTLRNGSEAIISCPLWFSEQQFREEVMDQEGGGVENPIICQFIDMPDIYHQTDHDFQKFFESLASADNFELFQVDGVQKIIEFNYPIVQQFTIYYLLIPFTVFLASYFIYFNMIFFKYGSFGAEDFDNDIPPLAESLSVVLLFVQGVLAVYFLLNEGKQIAMDPMGYVSSIWNYIDIIPPIGILLLLLSNVATIGQVDFMVAVQATTALFMWFKLLYFLRIFKETGYLIRMIVLVVYDMKIFLFVLLVFICAFADAFQSFSMANQEEGERFVTSFMDSLFYTYRMILGDFDPSIFQGGVAQTVLTLFFLLCTVLNMIVMLNLLISIISESFAQINSNAQNAAYREMAALIAENSYLIPSNVKREYAKKGLNLMIVTDLINSEEEIFDAYMEQFLQIKKETARNAKELRDDLKTTQEKQTAHDQKFEEMQSQLTQLNENVQKILALSEPEKGNSESFLNESAFGQKLLESYLSSQGKDIDESSIQIETF